MRPVLILAAAALLAACAPANAPADAAADSTPASDVQSMGDAAPRPSCEAIENACHPVEDRDMTTRECHGIAESATSTEAMCAMNLARCVAACAGDASTSGG